MSEAKLEPCPDCGMPMENVGSGIGWACLDDASPCRKLTEIEKLKRVMKRFAPPIATGSPFKTPFEAMEGAFHDTVYDSYPAEENNKRSPRDARTVLTYLGSFGWTLQPTPKAIDQDVGALVDAYGTSIVAYNDRIYRNESIQRHRENTNQEWTALSNARAAILAEFTHLTEEITRLKTRESELETELEGATRGRTIPEAARIKLAEAKAHFYHDRKLGTVVKVKDQIKVWRLITVAESFLGDPEQSEPVNQPEGQ